MSYNFPTPSFSTQDPTQQDIGKSLPEQIAAYIAEKIFRGDLEQGERLKEEELANHFKTSRAPIREALYLLQIDGLVERLPRRGTVVKEYTSKEIEELYEVRLGLEQLAIDKLEKTWNEDAYQQFCKVLQDMKTAIEQSDAEAYAKQNAIFHKLPLKLAGNGILLRLYQQLGNPLTALLQISTYEQNHMELSYQEHVQIVEIYNAKQFNQAKELISKNVHHGMTRVMQLRQRSK